MTKRAKAYQILTFVFGISLIILLLFMGITAVQKSMKLEIGFEVKPTFLCEIELNGEPIFSNHDENATIANGADLSGNTLTLNQTFYAELGAELTFTLYNYSEFKTKVSVKNTDKFVVLPAYSNGNASSGTITLDTPSGSVELVFEESTNYTITYTGDENTFDSSNPTTIAKGSSLQLHFNNYIASSPYVRDRYFQLPLTKAAGASDDYVIIKVGNIVLIENISFTPTIINGGELNIFIASEHITGDIYITIYTNCEM